MPDYIQRLKKLREEHGITQKELAKALNVTQTAITYWETGKREPSVEMLEKMADYYKVSPSYLMGWDEGSYRLFKAFENAEDDEKDNALVIGDILVSEKNLLRQYNVLNDTGKAEAIKRVSELKHIPEYTGDDDVPF